MAHEQANSRIDELEHRLAFQDQALEEFNQVLIGQQQQIDALHAQIDLLETRLSALTELQVSGSHDEKPPHY